ncbi:sialin-like [Varroa destructor]|uniref:Major facilitator superfamily (MFS) profile domain-containing protein n=1 Tax=Varroa destructor TaxID=109461 RepID=A0A7M7K6W6_VARDE|nr:sialin-like [Varroa destructor]
MAANVAVGGRSQDTAVQQGLRNDRRPEERWIQFRYVFLLLGFTGFSCIFVLRVNLHVAIVSMVNHTAIYKTVTKSDCYKDFNHSITEDIIHSDGPFEWSPITQGLVLGSYFWGYILTPIPGGTLAEKFSPRWLFVSGIFIAAVLGFLVPIVTQYFDYIGLVALRLFQGLSAGVTFPSIEVQLAYWVPEHQRAMAVTFVHSGVFVGVAVGMFVAGELAGSGFLGGWPSAFYVPSVFSIIWCVLWVIFITDTPKEHRLMSKAELRYITGDVERHRNTHAPTPWKAILLSPSAWAAHIALFGALYLHAVLGSMLPTYFGTVLYFDIRSNGMFSALPYVGATVGCLASGPICDAIVARSWLSLTNARKLFNAISLVVPSIILFVVVAVGGCNGMVNLVLFVTVGIFRGINEAGVGPIPIDIAPDFAGSVFGVSVMVAALAGIACPYITGVLTEEKNTTLNWANSFYVAGIIGLLSALIFQIFGTAEIQPWGLAQPKMIKHETSTNESDLVLPAEESFLALPIIESKPTKIKQSDAHNDNERERKKTKK